MAKVKYLFEYFINIAAPVRENCHWMAHVRLGEVKLLQSFHSFQSFLLFFGFLQFRQS